jgi:prolyl oligopeptidase
MLKVTTGVWAAALLTAAAWGSVAAAQAAPAGKPPVAPVRPVTETFFGTTLVDPYRYMETPGDPETLAWMKAQGDYTRGVLGAVPARAPYLEKLSALGAQFGLATDFNEAGGRMFYLERPRGATCSTWWSASATGAPASWWTSPP